MIRIRYKKISTNIYRTNKPILLGQYLANAIINVDTKEAEIYDGSHIIYKTSGKDFNDLKKKIRNAFKANNAQLIDEVKKIIK